jgi:hypothetical protein
MLIPLKHLEVLGRDIWRAHHREAFSPDVKSWVSRAGFRAIRAHRPRKVTNPGNPTRLAEPYTY